MKAPYGIIFTGDTRAIVGVPHGKSIPIDITARVKIRKIGSRHGYWYEGDGKDKALFPAEYRGSWDDLLAKQISGYPYEFLSVLFSNVKINKQDSKLTDPKRTIFDSILAHQDKVSILKDKDFGASTLSKFLSEVSQPGTNFTTMAKEPATRDAVQAFLSKGESLMFPKNWSQYPNPAGKVLKKMEDKRNSFILNRSTGVYFVGAGHILEMKRLDPTLEVIGGEKAGE